MRLVLDTNILVGALITTGTPPDRLYQAWLRGDIELVTSTAQIAEIADVLARPRLQKFLDADEAAIIVQNIGVRALVLDEPPGVNLSPRLKRQPDFGRRGRRKGQPDRLRRQENTCSPLERSKAFLS